MIRLPLALTALASLDACILGPPAGGSATASELCAITCDKKESCGLLYLTTLEECIFGCEQILATTYDCVPDAAEVEACRDASPAATCEIVIGLGGTGGPAECLPCFAEQGGTCADLSSCCTTLGSDLRPSCERFAADGFECGQILDSYRFEGFCS
ncbi:MAG: hypothetical protein AAF211_29580 [Myxococcota bacterium]